MLKIFFNDNISNNYPTQTISNIKYLLDKYKEDTDNVIEYYRNSERFVNNNHLLNRLINTLLPNIDNMDSISYLKQVNANAKLTSKQFGISSTINNGKILENVFYGKGSKEVLIYTEYNIDPINNKEVLLDKAFVKVIKHDDTNLSAPMPSKDNYIPDSIIVIEIDVIMLMMQYREWYMRRKTIGATTEINIFIATIVIPNMLPSIMDIAIVNRVYNLINKIPIDASINKHPFILHKYDNKLNNALKVVIKYIRNKKITFEKLLYSIPVVYNENALKALKLNTKYYTSQNRWVSWVSRVKYLYMILLISGKNGIVANRDIITRIIMEIKKLNRDRTITNVLDPVNYYSIELYIEDINRLIK